MFKFLVNFIVITILTLCVFGCTQTAKQTYTMTSDEVCAYVEKTVNNRAPYSFSDDGKTRRQRIYDALIARQFTQKENISGNYYDVGQWQIIGQLTVTTEGIRSGKWVLVSQENLGITYYRFTESTKTIEPVN